MYESILLESGKVFIGRRISGIGAQVVDDSRTITISVSIPEGIAEIVSVTAPSSFVPGVSFPIGVVIKNTGSFADMLFVKVTNVDTGDVLGDQSIYVNAGATASALSSIINLIQTTDFHGRVEVGHIT